MNFIRRLNRGNFIFQPTVLKFGDLLRGWKLATNTKFHVGISKIMPASPRKTGTWSVHYNEIYIFQLLIMLETIFISGYLIISSYQQVFFLYTMPHNINK